MSNDFGKDSSQQDGSDEKIGVTTSRKTPKRGKKTIHQRLEICIACVSILYLTTKAAQSMVELMVGLASLL